MVNVLSRCCNYFRVAFTLGSFATLARHIMKGLWGSLQNVVWDWKSSTPLKANLLALCLGQFVENINLLWVVQSETPGVM